MVIEKVFGLSSTAISLNDRFTILSTSAAVTNTAKKPIARAAPARVASGLSLNGQLYSEAEVPRYNVKQRLRSLAAINELKHRAWQYGLIRQALLRGRLSQSNIRNRLGKRGIGRGMRFRWNRVVGTQAQRLQLARRYRAFNQRGRGRPRGQGGALQSSQQNGPKQTARRGRPFVRGGRGRGRGRGGVTRQQDAQSLSKEQLDKELEQYMSCTKTALDKQLDEYMQDAAMDIGSID